MMILFAKISFFSAPCTVQEYKKLLLTGKKGNFAMIENNLDQCLPWDFIYVGEKVSKNTDLLILQTQIRFLSRSRITRSENSIRHVRYSIFANHH